MPEGREFPVPQRGRGRQIDPNAYEQARRALARVGDEVPALTAAERQAWLASRGAARPRVSELERAELAELAERGRQDAPEKPVVRGPVDSNVFAVLAAASRALERAGQQDRARAMREQVEREALSYHHALGIVMRYVRFDLGDGEAEEG
jgi:hypothetical protein